MIPNLNYSIVAGYFDKYPVNAVIFWEMDGY